MKQWETCNAVEEKEYILYFLTENNIIYSHPFTLKIYDDVPPIISGPNNLYFDKNNILTKNQILNIYYVYDEMYGYLSPYIYETNFDLEYKKEKYYLSIYGIDKSNNYTKKIVNIYMKHNKSIFYNSNVNITLFKNEIYSASSILFKIQDLKYIEKCEFSNIRFKNKKYIKFDKIGTFNEILELEKDGEKYEIYLNINVIEKEKNKESIINSLFNYILKLIDSLIDKIKKIFIN